MAANLLSARWPEKRLILNVYAVIVLITYGWSLYTSFWKVPSWMYYLNIGEILSIYAYSFTVNLIESLLLLLACLSPCLILPSKWWKEEFLSRSLMFVMIFLGSITLRLFLYGSPDYRVDFVAAQRQWWSVTFIVLLLCVWLAPKLAWLKRSLEFFADQCSVFVYFSLPISILSLVVVLIRGMVGIS